MSDLFLLSLSNSLITRVSPLRRDLPFQILIALSLSVLAGAFADDDILFWNSKPCQGFKLPIFILLPVRHTGIVVNSIIHITDLVQRFTEQAGINEHIFNFIAGVAVIQQQLHIGTVHAVAAVICKQHFFVSTVIWLVIESA